MDTYYVPFAERRKKTSVDRYFSVCSSQPCTVYDYSEREWFSSSNVPCGRVQSGRILLVSHWYAVLDVYLALKILKRYITRNIFSNNVRVWLVDIVLKRCSFSFAYVHFHRAWKNRVVILNLWKFLRTRIWDITRTDIRES